MTVSGVTTYNPSTRQIVDHAFQHMGIINETETCDGNQYATGLANLNSLIKSWQATGLHVWTEEEAVLFLQPSQRRYLIGGTNTDNCCDMNDYTLGTLSVAAAAGATSVTLTSATGLATGDYFGIVMDSGTAFWTTINGAPVGNVVTLTAALTGAASAQNYAIAYTTKINRPLRVPASRRLAFQGGLVTPLSPMMSRREFFDLPNPTTQGLPTAAYYNPARDQGEYWVWPLTQSANYAMTFTWYRPLETFLNSGDTADLPEEWNLPLEWCLAKQMGLGQAVSADRWMRIIAMAEEQLAIVEGWDRESQPVYFGRRYGFGTRP